MTATPDVLSKHPTWSQCPTCDHYFTCDSAFFAHMRPVKPKGLSGCTDPKLVRKGDRRLVFDESRGAWHWDGQRPVSTVI
jgi:hypothetical protein